MADAPLFFRMVVANTAEVPKKAMCYIFCVIITVLAVKPWLRFWRRGLPESAVFTRVCQSLPSLLVFGSEFSEPVVLHCGFSQTILPALLECVFVYK